MINEAGDILDPESKCNCTQARRGSEDGKIRFHCNSCHYSWTRPKLCHCSKCHASFSSDSLFKAHFERKWNGTYFCNIDEDFRRKYVFDEGIWRYPDRVDYIGIEIPNVPRPIKIEW